MSPALARPLLHTLHLITFLLLLGTGLLLLLPDLRAAVTGGYSLIIRATHLWGGVAFVTLPMLIVFPCGARRVFAPARQRTARAVWQGCHVALTIVISVVLALTGFALWGRRALSEPVVDGSLLAHDWLTYAAAAVVAIHLIEVGVATLVARLKSATAAAQESET
ncbi:MAG: cytochrome b/b6 domain-containing protein [Candidatus Binatia bacterium]